VLVATGFVGVFVLVFDNVGVLVGIGLEPDIVGVGVADGGILVAVAV